MPRDPRIIVAHDYRVLIDSSTDQVALRLQDGVIHTKPDEIDQYQLASFSSYDLKLSLNQSGYTATEERPSYEQLIDRLNQPQWRDPWALRRLTEYYKGHGVSHRFAHPVHARSSGRNRLEAVGPYRRVRRRGARDHRLLRVECGL